MDNETAFAMIKITVKPPNEKPYIRKFKTIRGASKFLVKLAGKPAAQRTECSHEHTNKFDGGEYCYDCKTVLRSPKVRGAWSSNGAQDIP